MTKTYGNIVYKITPDVFYKISVFKNIVKFTGKHLWRNLFPIKFGLQ